MYFCVLLNIRTLAVERGPDNMTAFDIISSDWTVMVTMFKLLYDAMWYDWNKAEFSRHKIEITCRSLTEVTIIVSLFIVALLDDLDKELNNYIMRCREWYGWHFPELGKIITDNIAYAKAVKLMGA